jgi:CHAT domain-containing protein
MGQKALGRARPRVHWCPLGKFSFLPLHAAGIYEGPNQVCASDYIVSSYAPSISSVIRARENWIPVPRKDVQALLVVEPKAPNLPFLGSAQEEIDTVSRLVHESLANVIKSQSGPTSSVEMVVNTLHQAHILHLACHGQQALNAIESSFALGDGQLSIGRMMQMNLTGATLAYLSACETAKADRHHPDQSVHLAASMLFCGFRSVIATMWLV